MLVCIVCVCVCVCVCVWNVSVCSMGCGLCGEMCLDFVLRSLMGSDVFSSL